MKIIDINTIIVDPNFDSGFYKQQYPYASTYYQYKNIPEDVKLYHHYIHYGKYANPKHYMNLSELQKDLGLDVKPPESFDPLVYENLYVNNVLYFNEYKHIIPHKYLMYHHYLNYGKSYGHSCNHNIIVFFHIPKCGGTYMHYGTILPNLFRQYHNNKYYIYNINWIDRSSTKNLFSTISYTENPELLNMLKNQDSTMSKQPYLKQATINFSYKNLDLVFKYSQLLCIIFNAGGFQNSDLYLQELIDRSHIKRYNKYTILREPQSLYESMFYYLRDVGSWEKTYGKFDKNMTFAEYIRHPDNYIDNWLIRQFAKLSDNDIITKRDMEICQQELETFTNIGFLELLNKFTNYLYQKYNWNNNNPSASVKLNKNSVSTKETLTTDDLILLNEQLKYEKYIYNYFKSKNYIYDIDSKINDIK